MQLAKYRLHSPDKKNVIKVLFSWYKQTPHSSECSSIT